jgi:hypothetical protein
MGLVVLPDNRARNSQILDGIFLLQGETGWDFKNFLETNHLLVGWMI